MQNQKKVSRVEITFFKEKGVITIMDLDKHGKAIDQILKALPLSAKVEFCSPCG